MSNQQIEQYILFLDQLIHIYSHSGIDWRPEYSSELQKIESELDRLRASARTGSEAAGHSDPAEDYPVPDMVSINTAAARTGLSYSHIRRLLQENKIPFVMSGSKYLLNFDALTRYLNSGDYEKE